MTAYANRLRKSGNSALKSTLSFYFRRKWIGPTVTNKSASIFFRNDGWLLWPRMPFLLPRRQKLCVHYFPHSILLVSYLHKLSNFLAPNSSWNVLHCFSNLAYTTRKELLLQQWIFSAVSFNCHAACRCCWECRKMIGICILLKFLFTFGMHIKFYILEWVYI